METVAETISTTITNEQIKWYLTILTYMNVSLQYENQD